MHDGIELLRHTGWARALARGLVGENFAEDAVQDALVVALARPSGALEEPRAWLARVVLRKGRDRAREERRRRGREERAARSELVEDAAELVARAECQQRLVRHVLALEEPYRRVLLARYFEDRPPREIARREGLAVQTVSNRLNRAHALLRSRLQREDGGRDWRAALLPLAQGAAAGGALLSVGKAAALAGALLVALAAGFAWRAADRPAPPPLVQPPDAVVAGAEAEDEAQSPASARWNRVAEAERIAAPLASSASLRGSVRDGSDAPMEGVELLVRGADGGELARMQSDAAGALGFAELPAARALHLELRVAGEPWLAEEFELAPGETRERAWTLFRTTRVVGVALDDHDRPVPNLRISLLQAQRLRPALLSRRAAELAHTLTDARGHFEIEGVHPGRYRIGPSPPERGLPAERGYELEAASAPAAPLAQPLEVPHGREVLEVLVRVWREPPIAGRVEYPDGQPTAGVVMVVGLVGADGLLSTATDAEGRFSFGPLAQGRYSLSGHMTPDGWSLPQPPALEPGADELVLVLRRAGSIAGRVVRASDGEPIDGWLEAFQDSRSPTAGAGVAVELSVERAGSFRIQSLAPGTYDIYAYSNDHAWCGRLQGVAADSGAPVEGLVVEVHPAARLRMLRGGAEDEPRVRISDAIGPLRSFPLAWDELTIPVPPGRVRVSLTPQDGAPIERSFVLAAGQEQVVRLDELAAGD